MFCEKYRCDMPDQACVVRRTNALDQNKTHCKKPGFADPNCPTCEVGAQLAKKIDKRIVREYSTGLHQAQTNALEFKERTGKLLSEIAELEVMAQKRVINQSVVKKCLLHGCDEKVKGKYCRNHSAMVAMRIKQWEKKYPGHPVDLDWLNRTKEPKRALKQKPVRKPPVAKYKSNPRSYEYVVRLLKDEIKYHRERIGCFQKALDALKNETPNQVEP